MEQLPPPGAVFRRALSAHDYVDPVIIHMDEQAMQDYGQRSRESWDRSLHARLLDRLSQDQPQVVVFDVELTQAGDDPAADEMLARAIRRNGRVVLAAGKVPVPGFALSYAFVPPEGRFETNAAAWGIAKVARDPDQSVFGSTVLADANFFALIIRPQPLSATMTTGQIGRAHV